MLTRMFKITLLLALGAILGAGVLTFAQQAQSGTRRIPQFENDHVRVWKSIIMPKQPLSMHRHDHPRALIALKGGTIKIQKESGEARTEVWQDGSAYWLTEDPPNELHADVNDTDKPIEVIVVELKKH
jgi:beta-alanine degradation protein BauB